MSVPDRKYLSEFAINLFTARFLVITPEQLTSGLSVPEEYREIAEHCHIYVICRRPASAFDHTSFSYDGTHVRGQLVYKISGVPTNVPFELPFELLDDAVDVKLSPYPYREFYTITAAGEQVRRVPAYALSISPVVREPALRQLEVLYIGQAYAEGKRTATDRLRNHETLQKLLAEFNITLRMIKYFCSLSNTAITV